MFTELTPITAWVLWHSDTFYTLRAQLRTGLAPIHVKIIIIQKDVKLKKIHDGKDEELSTPVSSIQADFEKNDIKIVMNLLWSRFHSELEGF